jgi:hypothetical protein
LENFNVLLFAFNRVVNVAHVHVHGVHHLFPHMCGSGAGRGRGANFFIIFFLCFQRNRQSRDERGRALGGKEAVPGLEYDHVLDAYQWWGNWGGTLAQRLMITGFYLQHGRWPNREHLRPVLMLSAKRVVNSRLAQENACLLREVEAVRRQEREFQGNVRKTASALNKLSSFLPFYSFADTH